MNEHIPGCWICPKCGFGLVKNVLYTQSGNMGPDESMLVERCPNDGSIMEPETYKMRCVGLAKISEALLAEMTWLDQHCSFVADYEYNVGPFRRGELRKLAEAGIAADLAKGKR